jgi:hypothetical protein
MRPARRAARACRSPWGTDRQAPRERAGPGAVASSRPGIGHHARTTTARSCRALRRPSAGSGNTRRRMTLPGAIGWARRRPSFPHRHDGCRRTTARSPPSTSHAIPTTSGRPPRARGHDLPRTRLHPPRSRKTRELDKVRRIAGSWRLAGTRDAFDRVARLAVRRERRQDDEQHTDVRTLRRDSRRPDDSRAAGRIPLPD